MIGFITSVGFLSFYHGGMAVMADVGKNKGWYPEFIYSGSPHGGLLGSYHDYDSSLPNYICRLIEGKIADHYPFDIILKLTENNHINEIVSRRKTTKDRFIAWIKKNVGSTDEIRQSVTELMWDSELKQRNFDILAKHGGFPYVYLDLKEWVDKCR